MFTGATGETGEVRPLDADPIHSHVNGLAAHPSPGPPGWTPGSATTTDAGFGFAFAVPSCDVRLLECAVTEQ